MGLAEGCKVGASEGVGGDVGFEDELELMHGFVLPALMDGQGGGGMRGGAAQCRGGVRERATCRPGAARYGRVVGSDGMVGPIKELVGFSPVMGEGSHVEYGLLGCGRRGF